MGLNNPVLKPSGNSKKAKLARIAVAKRTMKVNTGGKPLEYDDGVSRSTGGRGKVKAHKPQGIRQRKTSGEVWDWRTA